MPLNKHVAYEVVELLKRYYAMFFDSQFDLTMIIFSRAQDLYLARHLLL